MQSSSNTESLSDIFSILDIDFVRFFFRFFFVFFFFDFLPFLRFRSTSEPSDLLAFSSSSSSSSSMGEVMRSFRFSFIGCAHRSASKSAGDAELRCFDRELDDTDELMGEPTMTFRRFGVVDTDMLTAPATATLARPPPVARPLPGGGRALFPGLPPPFVAPSIAFSSSSISPASGAEKSSELTSEYSTIL